MKDTMIPSISKLKKDGYDVLLYAGPIDREGYDELCRILNEIEKNDKHKKIILFLATYGGDPNAGYRIARAIIHHYGHENFHIAIPSVCKSAGTLVCIGASKLIVFDAGELGPLDVQIHKQDEIFQRNSGLDILRGITYLQSEALNSFKKYLFDINRMGGVSTKIAAEIAGDLVKGLYNPIYAQIDPLRLGEMNAALQIANEYGMRLNSKTKSLKDQALNKLIHSYPTHGFVIDRSEAKELFENVSAPQPEIIPLQNLTTRMLGISMDRSSPIVLNLIDFFLSEDGSEVQGDGSNEGEKNRKHQDQSDRSNKSEQNQDSYSEKSF